MRLAQVGTSYISEAVVEFFVVAFGPEKPHSEAMEEMKPYPILTFSYLAMNGMASYMVYLYPNLFRFGSNSQVGCLSIPFRKLPPL